MYEISALGLFSWKFPNRKPRSLFLLKFVQYCISIHYSFWVLLFIPIFDRKVFKFKIKISVSLKPCDWNRCHVNSNEETFRCLVTKSFKIMSLYFFIWEKIFILNPILNTLLKAWNAFSPSNYRTWNCLKIHLRELRFSLRQIIHHHLKTSPPC